MANADFETKKSYFENTRMQRYIESARLEGLTVSTPPITSDSDTLKQMKDAAIARLTAK